MQSKWLHWGNKDESANGNASGNLNDTGGSNKLAPEPGAFAEKKVTMTVAKNKGAEDSQAELLSMDDICCAATARLQQQ